MLRGNFNVLSDNELCYVLPEALDSACIYIYILLRHGWVIDLHTNPHFSYTNLRGICRLLGYL